MSRNWYTNQTGDQLWVDKRVRMQDRGRSDFPREIIHQSVEMLAILSNFDTINQLEQLHSVGYFVVTSATAIS